MFFDGKERDQWHEMVNIATNVAVSGKILSQKTAKFGWILRNTVNVF